jgi:hypothetical protein
MKRDRSGTFKDLGFSGGKASECNFSRGVLILDSLALLGC